MQAECRGTQGPCFSEGLFQAIFSGGGPIRPAERGVVEGGASVAPTDRTIREVIIDLSPVNDYILHMCIFKAPLNSEHVFTRSRSLLKTSGGREERHHGCLVPIHLQGVWH